MNKFLYLVIISALAIASIAALFSVTGIATLFSGHFSQVAIMMGALEIGKIVLASLLYRYWKIMAIIHKSYMIVALLVLMIITSAGIFGYLSESYQKTRGDYTLIEKEVNILNSKRSFFEQRKERLLLDKDIELKTKKSNQTRADSLTSRNQSITRTREDIKESENRIVDLEKQISANEDSIGYYDLKIVNLESQNIKGELGPLAYIASSFDMEMDDVVKWLILLLIFVFDPLAISLIVAANMIYMKAHVEKTHTENKEFTEHFSDKIKKIFKKKSTNKVTETPIEKVNILEPINEDIGKIVKEGSEIIQEVKEKPYRKWHSSNWRE